MPIQLQNAENSTKKQTDSTSGSPNLSNKPKDSVLFPKSIATLTDSVAYTKKLIITAISNITYLRALFPEDYFIEREFEGLVLKIIKPANPALPETLILSEWLMGAFEAIDKKYLKCMSLALYLNSKEPDNVIETYNFNINYTDQETSLTLDAKGARLAGNKAKINATRLLRAILCVSQSLNDLPMKIYINMRLFYYEDLTPEDYQPNGFKESDLEDFKFENGKVHIDGGQVHSLWHQVILNVNVDHSMIKELNDFQTIDETFDSMNLNDSQIDSGYTTKSKLSEKVKKYKHVLDKTLDMDKTLGSAKPTTEIDEESQSLIKKNPNTSKTLFDETLQLNTTSNGNDIKCGCGLIDKEKDLFLLKCSYCSQMQHAICYNLNIETPELFETVTCDWKHHCNKCSSRDKSVVPTDKSQLDLDNDAVYKLCIWRRILIWLKDYRKVLSHLILKKEFELTEDNAVILIDKLKSKKILINNNKKKKLYSIDRSCLQDLISISFKQSLDSDQRQLNQTKSMNKSVCFDLPNMTQSQTQGENFKNEQTVPSTNKETAAAKRQNKQTLFKNELDSDSEMELDLEINDKKKDSPPKRRRRSSVSKQTIEQN